MRTLVACIASLTQASLMFAAVPTSAADEGNAFNVLIEGTDRLESQSSKDYLRFGCVVAFDSLGTLSPYPPEAHWCLIEKRGAYEIRSWRAYSGHPETPDNPETPLSEFRKAVPAFDQDLMVRDIPIQLALDLRQLWLHAVLESRFPPAVLGGPDGTAYVFTVERYASGQFLTAGVWSPRGDLPPKWLVDLGETIFEVASNNRPFDEKLIQEVANTQRKVTAYYEAKTKVGRSSFYVVYVLSGAALLVGALALWKRRHAS
jgi:hypothetical protein